MLQIPETVLALPVFYKQRENKFFPAWCYALPKTILDLPLSIWEALLWTAIPYFAVGFYKGAGRCIAASEHISFSPPVQSSKLNTQDLE